MPYNVFYLCRTHSSERNRLASPKNRRENGRRRRQFPVPRITVRVSRRGLASHLWDGPIATFLLGDALTSLVGRRKSGSVFCEAAAAAVAAKDKDKPGVLSSEQRRVFPHTLAFIPRWWRSLPVTRTSRWTTGADRRRSPPGTTLTSTSRSWTTSQRSTGARRRPPPRCPCTHRGPSGWTGRARPRSRGTRGPGVCVPTGFRLDWFPLPSSCRCASADSTQIHTRAQRITCDFQVTAHI